MQPATKTPIDRLTADRILKMTPEEINLYSDAERVSIDRILNDSYDRWDRGMAILGWIFKIAVALVLIFALVRFVRWAWYF